MGVYKKTIHFENNIFKNSFAFNCSSRLNRMSNGLCYDGLIPARSEFMFQNRKPGACSFNPEK